MHAARHALQHGHLIQLLLQLLDRLLLHNQHLLSDHGLLLSAHLLVGVASRSGRCSSWKLTHLLGCVGHSIRAHHHERVEHLLGRA